MDPKPSKKTICDIKCQYVANLRKTHKLKLPPGRPTRALYLRKFQELMMPVVDLSNVLLDMPDVATVSPEQNDEVITHSMCTTVPYQRVARTTSPISVPPLISVHIKSAVPVESHGLGDKQTTASTNVWKMSGCSYPDKEQSMPYQTGASNLQNGIGTRIHAISDHRTVFGVAEPASHTKKSGVKNVLITNDVTPVTAPRCRKTENATKRLHNSNKKTGRTGQAYAKIYKFLKSMPHKHLQGKLPPPSKVKGSHVSAFKPDGNVAQMTGHTIRKQLKLQASSQCIEKLSSLQTIQLSEKRMCEKQNKCIGDSQEILSGRNSAPRNKETHPHSPLHSLDVNDKDDKPNDHVCKTVKEDELFNNCFNPHHDAQKTPPLCDPFLLDNRSPSTISCDVEVPKKASVRECDASNDIPVLNHTTGIFEKNETVPTGTTADDTILPDCSPPDSAIAQKSPKRNEDLDMTVECIDTDGQFNHENRKSKEMENDEQQPADTMVSESMDISFNDTSSRITETNSLLECNIAIESKPNDRLQKNDPILGIDDRRISSGDDTGCAVSKSESTPDAQIFTDLVQNVETYKSMASSPFVDDAESTCDSKLTIPTPTTDNTIIHSSVELCVTDPNPCTIDQNESSEDNNTVDTVVFSNSTTHDVDQSAVLRLTGTDPETSACTISAPMISEQQSRPDIVVRRTALEVARDIVNKHIPSPKIADSNSPIKKTVLHSDKIDVQSSIAKALRVARQRIVDNSSNPQYRLDKNCLTEINMEVRAVMETMLGSLEESYVTTLVPPAMEMVETPTSSNSAEENQEMIIRQVVEKLVADTESAASLNDQSDVVQCTTRDNADDVDVNNKVDAETDQSIVHKAIRSDSEETQTIEDHEQVMNDCCQLLDGSLTQNSPAEPDYNFCDSRSESECHDCLHIDESYPTLKHQPNKLTADSYKGILLQTCRGSKRTFLRRRQKKRPKFKLTMPAKRRTASNSNDERKVPKLRLVSTDSDKSKDAKESRGSVRSSTKSFVIKPLQPQKASRRKRKIHTTKDNQDEVKTKQRKHNTKQDISVDDSSRKLYPRRDTIVYTSDIPEITNTPVPDTPNVNKPRRYKRKKSLTTESSDPVTPNATQTTASADIETNFTDDRLSMEFSKHNWILEKYKNQLQSPEIQASPGGIIGGPTFPMAVKREKPKKVRRQSNKTQKDSNKERNGARVNKKRRTMKLQKKAASIFEIPHDTNDAGPLLTSDLPVTNLEGNSQDEDASGNLKILEVVSLAGFIQEEKEISSDSDHTDDVGRLAICEDVEQNDPQSNEPCNDVIKQDSDERLLDCKTDVQDSVSPDNKLEATVQDLSIKTEKLDEDSLQPLDLSMKTMSVLDLSKKAKHIHTTEATYNCFNIKALDTTKIHRTIVSESYTQVSPKVSLPMCSSAPPIPSSSMVVKLEQSTGNPRSQSAHAFQTKQEPCAAPSLPKTEPSSDITGCNGLTQSNNIYTNARNGPPAKILYAGDNMDAAVLPRGSPCQTTQRSREQLLNDDEATTRSEIAARNVTPPDKIISASVSHNQIKTSIVPVQSMPTTLFETSPKHLVHQNVTHLSTNRHIPPMRPNTLVPVYRPTADLVRLPVQERAPAPAFVVSNGMYNLRPVANINVPMQRLPNNIFVPTTATFIQTSNRLRGHERYKISNETSDHLQQTSVSLQQNVSTTNVPNEQMIMSRGITTQVAVPSTNSRESAAVPRQNMVPLRMGSSSIMHAGGCQPIRAPLEGNTRFPGMLMERPSFPPGPQNSIPRNSFQAPNMTVVPAGRNVTAMPNGAMVRAITAGRPKQDRGSFQTSSHFNSGKRTEHQPTTEERVSHILNTMHNRPSAPKHGMPVVTYASRPRYPPSVPRSSEKTAQKTNTIRHGPDARAVSVKTKEGTVTMPLGHINCEGCSKRANFLCSGCKRVAYCSPECQFFSWKTHKNQCG